MRRSSWVLMLVLVAYAALTISAMRRTSTTFDEILLPSAGARGFETGKFDLVTDHPPLLQYVYGLPVYLSGVEYPSETDSAWSYRMRYRYARAFFWQSGNDPERLAFIARLPAVLIAAGLVATIFFWTRRRYGGLAASAAAAMLAFTPDVLAHGGISYNDIPLALAFFAAACVIDAAVRDPSWRRLALAALAATIAIGVKFSAVALGPLTIALLILERIRRGRDAAWTRRILLAVPVALLIAYATLVLIYLGDVTLSSFRSGFLFNVLHANQGHSYPAVLLGRYSVTGFWYYFPVAFLLKTPVGMQLLSVAGAVGLLALWRARMATLPARERWRAASASQLRVPLLASAVFLALCMSTNLNIGVRHALPVLPGFCILAGVGLAHAWRSSQRFVRGAILGSAAAFVISVLAAYPAYLSYFSDYVPRRDRYRVLVDSSADWGQGLLALRAYMHEHGIERVWLSYFGSAMPEGYGIPYAPLPSFFPLSADTMRYQGVKPRFAAVSATSLAGNYIEDRLAEFRQLEPRAVLLGSVYIFELPAPAAGRAVTP